ncbi:MAG: hypothetical protein ACOCRO_09595 [Halanaerobiales bacterium]
MDTGIEKLEQKMDNLLENGIIDLNQNLISITRNLYLAVREDSSRVNELYKKTEDIISYVNSLNFTDPHVYNRILSLISFKNDISLQNNLDKKQADLYLEEVKDNMQYKGYYHDSFTVPKVAECLSKIQYAYTLLSIKKNIRNLYTSFMNEVKEKDLIGDIIYELNTFGRYDSFSPGMLFLYYNLYRENEDINVFFKDLIIIFWKGYKIGYYNMSKEEVLREGFDKYDFIYK